MTTEKSETIRLQMMKENCNPESGNCDGFCHLCKKALDMAVQALEQEPKTGHWIKETPFLISECSECGNKAFGNHGFDEVLTKYCPNCGARMVESEDKWWGARIRMDG